MLSALIFLLPCLLVQGTPWDLTMFWGNDVYTGVHFDELLLDGEGRVKQHTLLVLYDPVCYKDMLDYGLTNSGLPLNQYLTFTRYNMDTTPRHIWYKLEGADDLAERYRPQSKDAECPFALFFRQGQAPAPIYFSLTEGRLAELESNPGAFKDWVWSQFRVRLDIVNQLPFRVNVSVYGQGPAVPPVEVEPGQRVSIEPCVSQKLVVEVVGRFVGGAVVEYVMDNPVLINDNMAGKGQGRDDWVVATEDRQGNISLDVEVPQRDLAYYYLRLFKQPVILPKFTYDGFERMRMPDELYAVLLDYYRQNQDRIQRGGCVADDGTPLVGVPCDSLSLPPWMRSRVHHLLFALVDRWSGTPQEMKYVWGLNIYRNGAKLPHYLGKVDESVVTVALPLLVDLAEGQVDWQMTLRDHHGRVRTLYLQPGDLLIYEGSVIEVAHPQPFQGAASAWATVHFRPQRWNWRYFDHNTKMTDDSKLESLEIFNTALTYKTGGMIKDEL